MGINWVRSGGMAGIIAVEEVLERLFVGIFLYRPLLVLFGYIVELENQNQGRYQGKVIGVNTHTPSRMLHKPVIRSEFLLLNTLVWINKDQYVLCMLYIWHQQCMQRMQKHVVIMVYSS